MLRINKFVIYLCCHFRYHSRFIKFMKNSTGLRSAKSKLNKIIDDPWSLYGSITKNRGTQTSMSTTGYNFYITLSFDMKNIIPIGFIFTRFFLLLLFQSIIFVIFYRSPPNSINQTNYYQSSKLTSTTKNHPYSYSRWKRNRT